MHMSGYNLRILYIFNATSWILHMSGYNLRILYIFNATSWIAQLKVKVLVVFLEKRILIINILLRDTRRSKIEPTQQ